MRSATSRHGRPWIRDLLAALTAGLAAFLGAFITLRLPLGSLHGLWNTETGPLWNTADILYHYGLARTIELTGWVGGNDHLGYPFVQDYTQWPTTTILNLAQLRLTLGLGADAVTASNLMFVLSYPLAAVAAFTALRYIGTARWIAVVLGTGFALLPWHYFRLTHLFLANYWAVAAGLVWMAVILGLGPRAGLWSHRMTQLTVGLLSALVIGLHEPYYLVFLLVVTAPILAFRLRLTPPSLGLGLRALVLVTAPAVFMVVLAWIRLSRVSPAIESSTDRPLDQQLSGGGLLTSLLVVDPGSVIGDLAPMRALQDALDGAPGEGLARFNLLTVTAVLVTLLVALGSLVGSPAIRRWGRRCIPPTARTWSGVLLLSILVFTVSGLGLAVAALVTPQIRVWGRLSVLIALLALAVLGLLLTALGSGQLTTRLRAPWRGVLAVGIPALLLLDAFTYSGRVTSDVQAPAELTGYDATASAALGDPACPVLTLPWIPFPEWGTDTGVSTYEQFLPYLYSPERLYSFGQFRGQLGYGWETRLSQDPGTLAGQAKGLGFCGIQVDTRAISDAAPLAQGLELAAGAPVATAQDRWTLFSLAGVAPVGNRDALFAAPDVRFARGFHNFEATPDQVVFRRMSEPEATVRVGNLLEVPQAASVAVALTAAPCAAEPQVVTVSVDGEDRFSTTLAPGGSDAFELPVALSPSGAATIGVVLDGELCLLENDPGLRTVGPSVTLSAVGSAEQGDPQ